MRLHAAEVVELGSLASPETVPTSTHRSCSLFRTWDVNGDGRVGRQEFEAGLRSLGLDVTSDAISDVFDSWDQDRSGELSMKELAQILKSDAIIRPLSHVDLDESEGAAPVAEQLIVALAVNAVKILQLASTSGFEPTPRLLQLAEGCVFGSQLSQFKAWDVDWCANLLLTPPRPPPTAAPASQLSTAPWPLLLTS